MSLYKEAQNTFKFPDTVQGSTLESVSFEVLVNDIAPLSSLSTATCVLAKDGATTLTIPITITSSANWQFNTNVVSAASMTLEEGLHVGDIETTDALGVVKKYARIELNILPSPQ